MSECGERHVALGSCAEGVNVPTKTGAGKEEGKKMIDARKLRDATLKELYDRMRSRKKSCATNPAEEAEYETQSKDWQEMYKEIEDEMKRRGLIRVTNISSSTK